MTHLAQKISKIIFSAALPLAVLAGGWVAGREGKCPISTNSVNYN